MKVLPIKSLLLLLLLLLLLPLLLISVVIAKDNSNNNSSFLAFRIIISKETLSWIIFQEILRHYDLFFLTDIKIQISFLSEALYIVPFYEYLNKDYYIMAEQTSGCPE